MKKIKKSTGITLIALIITVIVMIILVGVTVNVALNGGLFDTAKQAASGMEMAQIRERAEVVKANLFAEAQSNNNVILSKTELKNRLLQEFEGSTAEGDKVIVEDGKYDIIIKNTDLDIEVVEHSDNQYNTEPASIVGLDYTTSNIEADGELCVIKATLNLTKLMDLTQYAELRIKEDAPNGEITLEIKEQVFVEYFSAMYAEQFNSLDDVVLYDINAYYATDYATIEECLQDTTVQSEWGTTKEQLYYTWINWIIPTEGNEYTKEEVIDFYYADALNNKYNEDYNKYTRNLSVYVEKDGTQELVKSSVNITRTNVTVDYAIEKNGKYEFIVKTSDGEEIAREIMQINNLTTEENPYVLTKVEAEGIWETDGQGAITKYTGQDADVIVPVCIGTELINKFKVGAFSNSINLTNIKILDNITDMGNFTFSGCANLTNITIPNDITYIGNSTFKGCSSLQNINIPNNVTTIDRYAFEGCTCLKEITIPDNVTKINAGAFENCSDLENVKLSNNIPSLSGYIFSGCSKLNNLLIPKNVTSIGQYSFRNCTSLSNIVIEEGLISIEKKSFEGCVSLESIKIPNSVTSIETYTSDDGAIIWGDPLHDSFTGCTNLTNIYFAVGDNPIPDGQPWGAPNENLVVTKLTEQ